MTVALVYVHPRINQRLYVPMARRFARTYMEHPPGAQPHDLYVIINGDNAQRADERVFSPIAVKFLTHDNYGKDIGAFQMAARTIKADLMVFIGAQVHFRQAGWLDLLVNAYERNGPGIYGAYAFHTPHLHIRTTFFAMPPDLLNMYPVHIGNEHRYEFEHGPVHGVSKWCIDSGFNAWMVTWVGTFPPSHWRHVENQEALVLDQHSDRIGYK